MAEPPGTSGDLIGVVVNADGAPASGATVAVVEPHHAAWVQGTKQNEALTYEPDQIGTTDAEGRFEMLPCPEKARMLVLHEQGYATLDRTEFQRGGAIRLQPWARIEGIARLGSEPVAGRERYLVATDQPEPPAGEPIQFQCHGWQGV